MGSLHHVHNYSGWLWWLLWIRHLLAKEHINPSLHHQFLQLLIEFLKLAICVLFGMQICMWWRGVMYVCACMKACLNFSLQKFHGGWPPFPPVVLKPLYYSTMDYCMLTANHEPSDLTI